MKTPTQLLLDLERRGYIDVVKDWQKYKITLADFSLCCERWLQQQLLLARAKARYDRDEEDNADALAETLSDCKMLVKRRATSGQPSSLVAGRVAFDADDDPLPKRRFKAFGRSWEPAEGTDMATGLSFYDTTLRSNVYFSVMIDHDKITDAFVTIHGELREEPAARKQKVTSLLETEPDANLKNLKAFLDILVPSHNSATARVAAELNNALPQHEFKFGGFSWSFEGSDQRDERWYRARVRPNRYCMLDVVNDRIHAAWLENSSTTILGDSREALLQFCKDRPAATQENLRKIIEIAVPNQAVARVSSEHNEPLPIPANTNDDVSFQLGKFNFAVWTQKADIKNSNGKYVKRHHIAYHTRVELGTFLLVLTDEKQRIVDIELSGMIGKHLDRDALKKLVANDRVVLGEALLLKLAEYAKRMKRNDTQATASTAVERVPMADFTLSGVQFKHEVDECSRSTHYTANLGDGRILRFDVANFDLIYFIVGSKGISREELEPFDHKPATFETLQALLSSIGAKAVTARIANEKVFDLVPHSTFKDANDIIWRYEDHGEHRSSYTARIMPGTWIEISTSNGKIIEIEVSGTNGDRNMSLHQRTALHNMARSKIDSSNENFKRAFGIAGKVW
jgi:hypothetical protein